MTNAPRHIPSGIASLGPPVAVFPGDRPIAALGRFWFPKAPLWPAALSVALHVLVAIVVIWTANEIFNPAATSSEAVSFIPPPQRPAPPATRGGGGNMLVMVSLRYFSDVGSGNDGQGHGVMTSRHIGYENSGREARVVRTAADTGSMGDDVYTSYEVDNAVQISYGSAVPEYPPDLLARRVQGKVVVRFVVDTSGAADVESLEILDSSDPQFAASVRSALPHMRFSPARLNGKRVRQVVEQPFRFNVQPPSSKPADSGKVKGG